MSPGGVHLGCFTLNGAAYPSRTGPSDGKWGEGANARDPGSLIAPRSHRRACNKTSSAQSVTPSSHLLPFKRGINSVSLLNFYQVPSMQFVLKTFIRC